MPREAARSLIFLIGVMLLGAFPTSVLGKRIKRIEVISPQTAKEIGFAERALSMNDKDTALFHARNALRLQPKTAEAQAIMGVVASRRQEHPLAQKSFARALNLDADYFPAWYHQALWRCSQAQWEPAFADFRRSFLARRQSSLLAAYLAASQCALDGQRRDQARAFLHEGLQLMPKASQLLLMSSRLALLDNDLLRARAYLQRAEALRPLDAVALELAIDIERAAGDGRAQKRYEAALSALRDTANPPPG